ncbi:MAG TPA: NlpC/P60 family protein [Planctomycetota bacterium]|nr:NlpC/P60 family protein [Planctomycetota bacterium]
MVAWAADYVGIPYRFGGDSRDGADCWGLARMILRERFGRDVPAFDHEDGSPHRLASVVESAMPTIGAERVERPEPGDLALLKLHGDPCHVGVVIGDGYMIHTLGRHDSALDRPEGPRWAPRLEGYYRVR